MHSSTNTATRRLLLTSSVALTALLCPSVALGGQAQFVAIPGLSPEPASSPNGCVASALNGYSFIRVSADGQVVTAMVFEPGFSEGAIERYVARWTEAEGLQVITPPLLNDLNTIYGPFGISADGRTIWGDNWRWTMKGGFERLSTLLPGDFRVFGCTDDGNTVTGVRGTYGFSESLDLFRWTVGDAEVEILPRTVKNPEGYFYFNTISADGSTIGAVALGPEYTTSAVVIGNDGPVQLTPTQPQFNWLADFSSDGSVGVGQVFSPPFSVKAVRWTAEGGLVDIGPNGSGARACSADGTVVGGSRIIFGVPGEIAWIRIGDAPLTDLKDYLITEQGLAKELDGWRLDTVQDISADGRTIVGCGINPEGCEQGFLVRINLPNTNDIADMNSDGSVNSQDLAILLSSWGNSGGPADINGDGTVNSADLAIMLSRWSS